jgi:DNA transformation protein
MANDADFVLHCQELLAPTGPVRVRRMFGGHGLYVSERFVAILLNDTLYLKADAQSQPEFEAAGCAPFTYTTAAGQRTVLAFRQAPDEAMESPAQMLPWARLALGAALRAATPGAKRPASQRRSPAQAAGKGRRGTG